MVLLLTQDYQPSTDAPISIVPTFPPESGPSPSKTRAGPFPASLPRTPDFNHNFSPSGVRRGCAESPSRLSLSPTPAAAAAAATRNGTPSESGGADGRTGAGPGIVETGAFTSRPPLPREEGGRSATPGAPLGHPPLVPSPSTSTPASPSLPLATAGGSTAASGRRSAVRDYGPGIPVTRIASWSTFGDEGGGTILGYDDDVSAAAGGAEQARNGGSGQDGQGSAAAVPSSAETSGPAPLAPGRRLEGGFERGFQEPEQQIGAGRGQGSPPSADWAT